jgi:hypothetical protein
MSSKTVTSFFFASKFKLNTGYWLLDAVFGTEYMLLN